MTTISETEKECFICGETNKYPVLGSTNRFGSSDLDTRPPEMMRSTMSLWIQCCPSCGYCAPDISDGPQIAAQVIKSDSYLKQKTDHTNPELATKFLCGSIIQEVAGEYSDAGWEAVRAAWVCDDAKARTNADVSRQRAVRLFDQARTKGTNFAEGSGVEEAILADLLRRSGDFEKVGMVCEQGLKKEPEEIVKKILLFQQSLSSKKDAECYTIEEMDESETVQQDDAEIDNSLPQDKAKKWWQFWK